MPVDTADGCGLSYNVYREFLPKKAKLTIHLTINCIVR